jgi:hypothetical protein
MEGSTVEELQAQELECIRRFRSRAQELRNADPTLSPQLAFVKAVESMPKVADRYQWLRSRLGLMGVPALKLR